MQSFLLILQRELAMTIYLNCQCELISRCTATGIRHSLCIWLCACYKYDVSPDASTISATLG